MKISPRFLPKIQKDSLFETIRRNASGKTESHNVSDGKNQNKRKFGYEMIKTDKILGKE
jgi:hypothetical protein